MKRFFNILTWLPQYNISLLKADLIAGITIGVVLIPQAMAYALVAGMPPVHGLYAALVPLFIYGFMGTSPRLGFGPVAVVALLVAAGVGNLAEPGSAEYIHLAILLAAMVGVMQLFLGLFRMGFLVNFLSHPVNIGFIAAAALIIAFSQIHHLLGIPLDRSSQIHTILIQIYESRSNIHPGSVGLGLAAIGIIYGTKKWDNRIPGSLVAVAGSILLVAFGRLDQQGISVIGDIPTGLPAFVLPGWTSGWDGSVIILLLPMAAAISLVGYMQSIAIAKAMQSRRRDHELDTNQELVAMGSANLAGSFFQAFPVAGSISRSAVSDQSGAKTGMADIFSAVLVGLTLLFLTPLFYYLPNAVLAATIITAVIGLIDIREMVFLWRIKKEDFVMMAITFISTLILGIEEGILIGVLASLGVVIYHSSNPHVAHMGRLPGTRIYRNVTRFSEAREREDVLVFRYDASLFFANVEHFKDTVDALVAVKGPELRLIVVDASGINAIDTTGIQALFELDRLLVEQGIELRLASVRGPVRDLLGKSGFSVTDGDDRYSYMEVQEAIDDYDEKKSTNEKSM